MNNLKIDSDLIFINKNFKDREEALKFLANELYLKGYVKEQYIESIIDREKNYPTGLPSTYPKIAIPHTSNDLVNTTSIAVMTLEKGIKFRNMENNEEEIDIDILVMLAISEPKAQLEMLQSIVKIIQDESLRLKIKESNSKQEIKNIFMEVL